MSLLDNLFKKKDTLLTVEFKGRGYTAEEALHLAEQRMAAWVKDKEKAKKRHQVISKEISYSTQSDIQKTCKITCEYRIV